MEGTPRDHRQLLFWAKAHALTLEVYRVTKAYPRDEIYGLTSQTRRAASSVPANIAEGCGRGSERELERFLSISIGSNSELSYHLLLAKDLGYLKEEDFSDLDTRCAEVGRMLNAYRNRLKSGPSG